MAPEVADRLAAVVAPGQRFSRGDQLPALWHWAYFPELAPLAELGRDGHPRRHDELAERFPRRMAGGGKLRQIAGLVIGEPAQRHSELIDTRERRGRKGEMVICDWRHTYSQGGAIALEEVQSIIYRRAGDRVDEGPASARHDPSRAELSTTDEEWQLVRRVEFSPVMLFRFSAATWNSHRIHYDRPFAIEEGYPGLLVHGLAILLASEAERVLGVDLSLEFRSVAPTFDTDTVGIYLQTADPTGVRVEARRSDGTTVTSLSASRSAGSWR
ncbi:MAG: acyl-CoA dehydrogenase [Acidimicrobiales bacterium]|jgi:3-methylfumaryl-CoA hydratase